MTDAVANYWQAASLSSGHTYGMPSCVWECLGDLGAQWPATRSIGVASSLFAINGKGMQAEASSPLCAYALLRPKVNATNLVRAGLGHPEIVVRVDGHIAHDEVARHLEHRHGPIRVVRRMTPSPAVQRLPSRPIAVITLPPFRRSGLPRMTRLWSCRSAQMRMTLPGYSPRYPLTVEEATNDPQIAI